MPYKYLVHIKALDDRVEQRVEAIEQADHLHGRGLGRQVGEAADVAEVDGDAVEALRVDFVAEFQLFGHVAWQHLVQQRL